MLQLPPQHEPPDSTTVSRFFSSGTGASVIGAGSGDVVMASMLTPGARRAARHSRAPPVWHVGQYCADVPENVKSRIMSPHTGHASPARPCTRIAATLAALS